jgi:hypothetical protein
VRAVVPAVREVGRRAERLGAEPPGDDRPVRTLILDSHVLPGGPELTEEVAYAQMLRERAQSWVDTPNTTGMTPRQAVGAGGAAPG